MGTAVQKLCCTCGQDVSQQKRVKDQQGRYYCHPCWADRIDGWPAPSDALIAPEPHSHEQAELQPASMLHPWDEGSQNDLKTEAAAEGMSKVEKAILFGGIVVGLIVVVGLVYFLFMRTWWEDHNRTQLLALKEDADTLARTGKLVEAKMKYDELFGLLGDRQVYDQSLQDDLNAANASLQHVSTEITDEEQAKQKAELEAAQKAEAEQEAAANRAEAEQEAAANRAEAEQQRTEAEELAKQDAEQQQLQAHQKDIADTWLGLAKVLSDEDDLAQLCESQKELLDSYVSAGNVEKAQQTEHECLQTIDQKSACAAQALSLLKKIQSFDTKERNQIAQEIVENPDTPTRYRPYIQHFLQ